MRQRTVNNENDENAAPARLTRAKAAAQGGSEMNDGLAQKSLHSKVSGNNTTTGAPVPRKRAALGDLSNVVKNEAIADKGAKKAVSSTRPALANKAPSGGVQKINRTSSTRAASGPKDVHGKRASSSDLKRVASGAGMIDRALKKRSTGSVSTQGDAKESASATEKQSLPAVAVTVEAATRVEKKETITVEDVKSGSLVVESTLGVPSDVPDLDEDDRDDPIMVAEYATEIFNYLRDLESQTRPNPDYMDHQEQVDWRDRDILNDWLVQVHQKFQLLPETLYLAINILDRFLSHKVVQLDKFQLVGITALFIASKYEEVISPHISYFTHVAKDYTEAEVLASERFILEALDYDLSYPNPLNFVRRISKADNYDIQTRTLSKYLLEISVLDHRFLEFAPSQIAAAAMYMARLIMNRGHWVCAQASSPRMRLSANVVDPGCDPCALLRLHGSGADARFHPSGGLLPRRHPTR